MAFEIMTGGIALVVIALAVLSIPYIRKQREIIKKTGKYPEGYFLGQGMGLGLALGIPLGVGMGNVAIGPAIGLPLGVAIGKSMEKKYTDKIRPLTKEEKDIRKKLILFGCGALAIGIIAFFIVLR